MPITSGSSVTKSVTNRCPMVHLGKSLKRYLNRTLKFLPCKNLTKSLIYIIFVEYLPCCLLIYYKCFIFLSFINWTKVSQSVYCWTLLEQTILILFHYHPRLILPQSRGFSLMLVVLQSCHFGCHVQMPSSFHWKLFMFNST
jgi:hypothetical protein